MATIFTPRTRAQIRDTILANWQARYRSIGLDLNILPRSDSYMQADAFALELEAIEVQAQQNRNDILPDKASTTALNRHGTVDGIPREPATYARFTVQGTCSVGATLNLTNKFIQSTGGVLYTPEVTSVTDGDSDSVYSVTVKANIIGTDGNLPVGALLQWTQTPIGATSAIVTITTVVTTAADEEEDADYALRIIKRRQERPGSGNRADWADWVTGADGVSEAFVFPLLNWTLTSSAGQVLGCVTVIPLGPAQGDSATNTRVIVQSRCNEIKDYIEGTRTKSGGGTNGTQLRPCTMKSTNYFIVEAPVSSQEVVVTVFLEPGYRNDVVDILPWQASTTTYVDVLGNRTYMAGQLARIWVGTAYYRGGYAIRKIATAVYSSPNTRLTFDTPVSFAPSNDTNGNVIYPAPANDDLIRNAIFDFFDRLTPGTTNGTWERYPTERSQPSTLFRNQLIDAIIPTFDATGNIINGAQGVYDITLTTPSGIVIPAIGTLVTLGRLKILQG